MVEVFNRDGIDASLELATPDVLIATAQGFPGGGRFEGADEAATFLEEFVATWEQVRYEVERPQVVNGCVVHVARWVVRGKATQGEAAAELYGVARFREGLVSAIELFWTEEEAIEHARATPQGGSPA